ncbi:MAG TPA: glycoside hydrolase family 3 C-terminal domain-containing protein [Acidimicrobiales bacterium]|nr:glycoside hydrolase family 3 C-terminal domain-containing protein [Acidimicrobiales bacterium]
MNAEELEAELTPEEKASLTAGGDVWRLPPIERLGIGRLKMSDGPSGVRGGQFGTRRSLSFPCGMAAGSTWDLDLIRRYGEAVADEAISKGVHLVLGPTVCIPRTPLGGRTFESFAEDPYLSARVTAAYVAAVQAGGVGCCVKHFACNDQEHERMTISAEVDERTLREVHLPSFEAAVVEAGAWAVMSAYNRLNGTFCGEHPELLGGILKDEWGFDGVVVSDWFGTHSTVEASTAGLDIEMPGPPQYLGPNLAEAVKQGSVDTGVVDEHASRIARLMERTGLLAGRVVDDEREDDDPQRRALARELAAAGTVLLRNDGLLPLAGDGLRRVAVIGPNARALQTGGGGSSVVVPFRHQDLVDELRDRLPGVEVVHEEGCRLTKDGTLPTLDMRLIEGGFRTEYWPNTTHEGEPLAAEALGRAEYIALGDPAPGVGIDNFSLRSTTTFRPDTDGTWTLGLASVGPSRLLLDGEVVIDNTRPERAKSFFGMGSTTVTAEVELSAGTAHELSVELTSSPAPVNGFRVDADRPAVPDALGRAVAAARDADAVVLVVGSNPHWETEGVDRKGLALVGEQAELVRAVVAANPHTAVVVNAGAPVDVAPAEGAASLMMLWYPGEEGPAALAEMLVGTAEPSGRLPITFPHRIDDVASHTDPTWYPGAGGKVRYGEGVFVGYRHFDANGVEPAFAFGHGTGYSTFDIGDLRVDGSGTDRTVALRVTNTGERRGAEVVQVYVAAAGTDAPAGIDRPAKELKGFAKVVLDPGESTDVRVALDHRSFARWDVDSHDWVADSGTYDVLVGVSSRDIRQQTSITA